MTTMMSAIGEVTGMKPSDQVICNASLLASKMKVQAYCLTAMECITPAVRHLLSTHLQDCLSEQERFAQLAVSRGWFNAASSPEEQIRQALDLSQHALHQ